jgi:uncharacterized protein YheU (UPF0270 family)
MNKETPVEHHEQGVVVPFEQIDPQTLRNMIEEFVSRDGADWAEADCTLADKVGQVLRQLRDKKVQIVFDLSSETANIVVCR